VCSSCMQQTQRRPEAAPQLGRQLVRRPWLRPFHSPQQQQRLRQQRCQRQRLQHSGSSICASAAASPAFEVHLAASSDRLLRAKRLRKLGVDHGYGVSRHGER
jgi:hypothetical protein